MKKIFLVLVLILAATLRFYKLDSLPPSLSWDEASIGYDAFALNTDGKDQWGEKYPLIFRSFGEYKYPFNIYAVFLSQKVFGFTDFATRSPFALLGVINILLVFILTKLIVKEKIAALLAATLLAISPWYVHLSRGTWEINFSLFFFLLGIIFFTIFNRGKKIYLPLSLFFFGMTLFTYNSSKVFIPLFLISLIIIFFKDFLKFKLLFLLSILIFLAFLTVNFLNPVFSGGVRYSQVLINEDQYKNTQTFKMTENKYLAKGQVAIGNYFKNLFFLFYKGDSNPRHNLNLNGQIFLTEAALLIIGLVVILKRRNKWDLLLLVWLLLAPLPAAITRESPHAVRSMFMLGGIEIIAAIGFLNLIKLFQGLQKKLAIIIISLGLVIETFLFCFFYQQNIFNHLEEWQYGYRQIFDQYKDKFKNYDNIVISDQMAQPYIFALYYLKYNPQKFRESRQLNTPDQFGFSTVVSFDKFKFMKAKRENLPKGKSLIFTSTSEKLGLSPIDITLDGKAQPVFYIYEN